MAPQSNCCQLDQTKYSLYSLFKIPKLFRQAAEGKWDQIPKRCRFHPKEAQFVHKYPPNDTALHRIVTPLQGGISTLGQEIIEWKLKAIDALMKANHQAANVRDVFGRTPLHLECMDVRDDVSERIFSSLLQYSKVAASLKDRRGRLPLHVLLMNHNEISEKMYAIVYFAYPEALEQQDIYGASPLQFACQSKGVSSMLFKAVLFHCPKKMLEVKNRRGQTVLHTACENLTIPCRTRIDIAYQLAEACPLVSDEFDNEGNTPFLMTIKAFRTCAGQGSCSATSTFREQIINIKSIPFCPEWMGLLIALSTREGRTGAEALNYALDRLAKQVEDSETKQDIDFVRSVLYRMHPKIDPCNTDFQNMERVEHVNNE